MPTIQTEILPINSRQPEEPILAHAATLLRAGELVVFPTETVYGLGPRLCNQPLLRRYSRPKSAPIAIP
ncbi:hypothetical protein [Ktedonobacter robiniae]|uniref:hypothetical protein n=1 Tax=Ktedonobacter robiniae TaxID=2778365 RepID=UPI00191665F5|nr:hypothetical protein [Ktedonobacter robiniae]